MASERQLGLNGIPVSEEMALTPMAMAERAMDRNLPPDVLKGYLEFILQLEANEARKAYVRSMNLFKANPPSITKNRHVKYQTAKGVTEYDHATLDHVCEQVTQGLSAVGISHRYETSQADKLITVTCVLTHEKGHSERTTLMGLPDDTGSKNSIQAIGSTVTYLQRYTLLAATGLAAEGTDNDGAGFKLDSMEGRLKEIAEAADERALKSIFESNYQAAKKVEDGAAMLAMIKARDKRKEQLLERTGR